LRVISLSPAYLQAIHMSQLLPQGRNWAVAVVHGVGTPLEGATTQAVCRAIQAAKPDFRPADVDAADVHADVPNETRQVAHERPEVRIWSFGEGGRAKVAEVFWSDLAEIRGSIPDMVRALGYNLHAAIHLCKSALQSASLVARLLLLIPFYLLRWVILPLHMLALGIALPFGLWMLSWDDPRAGDYLTSHNGLFLTLTLSYAVAGILAGMGLVRRRHHQLRPPPWDLAFAFAAWSALSALFILPSLVPWFKGCVDQAAHIDEYGTARALMDLVLGRFGLTEFCHWILTETDMGDVSNHYFGQDAQRLTGIGRYIAVNELAGDAAFVLCSAAIVLLIVLTVASALLRRDESARVMLLVATICSLVVGIVAILTEAVDFLTRLVQFWIDRPGFITYFYEYGLVVWLAIVVMAAVVIMILRQRELLASGKGAGALSDYSRVIVSQFFQITVVVAALARTAWDVSGPFLQKHYPSLVVAKIPIQLMTPAFLVFLVALIIFSKPLRLGLVIAMDIIDHFLRSGGWLPIRRAVSQRLYDVLDRLTGDGERPHLLVVAHSQGTVITIDALVKDIWSKPLVVGRPPLSEQVSSMTILTFGSPLTHIYQHYFPKDYRPFSETSLQELAADERVQWVNIFREDDPIGTHIKGPTEEFPRNVAMQAGGHTRYWEKDVFDSPLVRLHLPGA
jgi:hypothetical protein